MIAAPEAFQVSFARFFRVTKRYVCQRCGCDHCDRPRPHEYARATSDCSEEAVDPIRGQGGIHIHFLTQMESRHDTLVDILWLTGFLNKNKIHRIMLNSDGNTKPILVIEAGIKGHWPLEVNSSMDVRALSK